MTVVLKGGMIDMDLISLFSCGHLVFPASLAEDAFFSPIKLSGIFVGYQMVAALCRGRLTKGRATGLTVSGAVKNTGH